MKERLQWLSEFSRCWDFRNIQKNAEDIKTGEKARWLVKEEVLSEPQTAATMKAATKMGLVDSTQSVNKQYDSILVLGGARMSCLYRMKYARELCESHGVNAKEIVGLTGMRPISETERSATDTYAPKANTEFDLMCAAAQKTFDMLEIGQLEKGLSDNLNNAWAVMRYGEEIPITVLAAPSSEPMKRRANTADTFSFWMKHHRDNTGKRLLLITSQIYVPYQQLEAVRILGFPHGCSIETVGFPREWSVNLQGAQTAVNYLQEIRSALLSMKKIV
jgi:hypothetical protein